LLLKLDVEALWEEWDGGKYLASLKHLKELVNLKEGSSDDLKRVVVTQV
jgi:hypothetical protein